MRLRFKVLPIAVLVGLVVLLLPFILAKMDWWLACFDDKATNKAYLIGGIIGPYLSFVTLLLILFSFFVDTKEKKFRLSFDLIDKLVNIYADAVEQYQREGAKRQYFDDKGNVQTGVALPYLQRTHPLFIEVVTRLRTGHSSQSQYQALVSILSSQLQPMVDYMNDEAIRLDSGVDIAQQQVAQLAQLQEPPTIGFLSQLRFLL